MEWNPTLFDLAHAIRPAPDLEATVYAALASRAGGPVLELGCGTGRVLVALRARGIDVDGLDASPQMVSAAQQKLMARGDDPQRVTLADARTFTASRAYALVLLAGNVVGSFPDSQALELALRAAASSLAPRGQVALDMMCAPTDDVATVFESRTPAPAAGQPARYFQRVSFERASSTQVFEERLELDTGDVIENRMRQRVWSVSELEHASAAAGLSVWGAPVDERGRPPSGTSRVLFVRLRRAIAAP